MKVCPEGPMYTHSDFRTSTCRRTRMVAKNMKRASVLHPITQATGVGPEAHQSPLPQGL